MKRTRRILAVLLAVLALFAILTSFSLILHKIDHDCPGEDCPTCAAIATCWETLSRLTSLLLAGAVCVVLVASVLLAAAAYRRLLSKPTPVSLNVKLLN